MKKIKFSKSYITITVLILMMVLVAVSYLYADSIFSELAIARNNKGASVAFALAEAGVQRAIYQVKYESAVRTPFVTGDTSCCSKFTQDPALIINNGSFEETITVTGEGLATITAVGKYTMGLRTAVREIKTSIAQSVDPPVYNGNSGIFISNTSEGSPSPLSINHTTIKVYGGGIVSGGGLSFHKSTVWTEKTIESKIPVSYDDSELRCNCTITTPDPEEIIPMCSEAPECTPTIINDVDSIPAIDILSSDPGSYKSLSQNSPNHYFSSQSAFLTYMQSNGNTISGIVFVDVGSNGTLDIGTNTFTVNGVLVSSNDIYVPNGGGLIITHTPNQPSGVIAVNNLGVHNKGVFEGTGLIYAGNSIITNHPNFNVTGGIFGRSVEINQGTINIYFDKDIINAALPANPADTPIIDRTFWEEEY